MTPQEFYNAYTAKKEQVKVIHEELEQLEQGFLKEHEMGLEYPITVEDKQKFVRIEEGKGRYVYNIKFEVGVRAVAKNPA